MVDVEDYIMVSSFEIINIYDPYVDKCPFWEGLSESWLIQAQNVIIGEDLNFTLSLKEVCGRHPRRDLIEGFFIHWIASHQLVDLEPPKLFQMWRNGHKGEDLVAKRLDMFMIADKML